LFSRYAIIDSSQHACSDAKKGELLIDFTHQLTAAGPDGRLKPHKRTPISQKGNGGGSF
jgi:hypothetical protein